MAAIGLLEWLWASWTAASRLRRFRLANYLYRHGEKVASFRSKRVKCNTLSYSTIALYNSMIYMTLHTAPYPSRTTLMSLVLIGLRAMRRAIFREYLRPAFCV